MVEPVALPVIPLRDTVIFPGVTTPIAAGRPATLRAVKEAVKTADKLIFAVSQRQNVEDVSPEGLHTIGTIARIGQLHSFAGGVKLLLHGERRGIAMRITRDRYFEAVVRDAEEMYPSDLNDPAFLALQREVRERATELGEKSGLSHEVAEQVLDSVLDASRLADIVGSYLELQPGDKQILLETLSVEERLRRVLLHVQRQIGILDAQADIKSRVQQELGDRQREMVLREQLKAIQQELGESDDGEEVDDLREKLVALELPAEARKEVDRELRRLRRMSRESMEYQVVRNYLETIAELPWNARSTDVLDLQRAAEILEEDHYGLSDVKDRVLEYLAVRQLRDEQRRAERADEPTESAEELAAEVIGMASMEAETTTLDSAQGPEAPADSDLPSPAETGEAVAGGPVDQEAPETPADEPAGTGTRAAGQGFADDKTGKAPILLFVGPPGVGKTSIARSIARAMGREYVRISLGGARDEADIRGHRRTYVGAMPGRILQGMRQAGTKNPVFLLDEVDKLGISFQGDPASALLEVLDPAQNDSFVDHYLGVPFDLSEVLFIATANFVPQIPPPLLDRMEMVEFSGYTEREKLEIARRYLLPRQLREAALAATQMQAPDEAIGHLIAHYTREAGVRQLERELGRLARKVARKIASREVESVALDGAIITQLLGRPKIHPERAAAEDQIGVATGMYYTPAGGDIMFVEATRMKGKGNLLLTGQLGDVMKESARAALSFARSRSAALGINEESFEEDIHIHVPAGAIPKDGPSAGVTMATALVSSLAGRPARHDLAMTGEITLSGRVLAIGGVKEKVLGAVRAGIQSIVLPSENRRDLDDLPPEVLATLDIHAVEDLESVLELAIPGLELRRSGPALTRSKAGGHAAGVVSH